MLFKLRFEPNRQEGSIFAHDVDYQYESLGV